MLYVQNRKSTRECLAETIKRSLLSMLLLAGIAFLPTYSSAQALVSGTYRVEHRNSGRTYVSTWTLQVYGNQISGTSDWQCCPGPRRDPLSGSIAGNSVTIQRDCRGQGYQGECRQEFKGTIGNGVIQGFAKGTGASPNNVWTLYLAASTGDSLTGRWSAGNRVYNLVQNGNAFTWTLEGTSEVGQGTITGDDLQVSWTGGGSATGRITQRDANGMGKRIEWSNGVAFSR